MRKPLRVNRLWEVKVTPESLLALLEHIRDKCRVLDQHARHEEVCEKHELLGRLYGEHIQNLNEFGDGGSGYSNGCDCERCSVIREIMSDTDDVAALMVGAWAYLTKERDDPPLFGHAPPPVP